MIWFRLLLGILGVVTFGYGIRCFHKDHYKSALACLGLSAVFLLTDPTSFQGFLKTGIIAKLNSLGRTVDKIQDTLVEQQRSLSTQQGEIKVQQKELGNQQSRITSAQETIAAQQEQVLQQQVALNAQEANLNRMQQDLQATQTRIAEQQSKIEDVEFLVENLFEKSRQEKFSGSDSNRFFRISRGDNAHWFVFKLKEAAIPNSVHGYFDNDTMKPGFTQIGNIVATIFVGDWKIWKDKEYNLTYVANPKDTRIFKSVEIRDDEVYLDGRHWIDLKKEKSNKAIDSDKK